MLRQLLRALLRPDPPPVKHVCDGACYRFRDTLADDVYLARGDRLVNLTAPGRDLRIAGDHLTNERGQVVAALGALMLVDRARA